jgi:ABC-type nitrate/sulfonate/bicarbonate transport system ATPase subunit
VGEREQEQEEPMTASSPILSIKNVSKSYTVEKRDLHVLDDISIHANRGEFVSIIGPSGSGKSTLMSIIAGLDQPDSGSATIEGTPAAPGRCAYMPQKDSLLPWRRVIGNASLGLQIHGVPRAEARQRVTELLPVFGLQSFGDSYPGALSGGMRQRAALLRTVVQERPVMLLDEPLGALDSLTRLAMQEWLADMWQKYQWTMVLITHDIREAVYLSDRVYTLGARPARVTDEITIDLPRPRTPDMLTSPEAAAFEARLLAGLHGHTGV